MWSSAIKPMQGEIHGALQHQEQGNLSRFSAYCRSRYFGCLAPVKSTKQEIYTWKYEEYINRTGRFVLAEQRVSRLYCFTVVLP